MKPPFTSHFSLLTLLLLALALSAPAADTKITGLSALLGADADKAADVLPIVDVSVGASAAANKKITIAELFAVPSLTLVTPNLGTPSAIVLTNASGTAASLTAGTVTTNANLTGHVTSVGNAAVLGSFTLAQLNTAVSDADLLPLAGGTLTGVLTLAPTTPGQAQVITSGTVTTSIPLLDMTQTWNSAGVAFTAVRLNVTNTASAGTSKLLSLQVGSSDVFAVANNGGNPAFHSVGGIYQFFANGTAFSTFSTGSSGFGNEGLRISNTVGFGWTSGAANASSPDTHLIRDSSAGSLAQRASTTAQTFRVYGVADTVQTLTNYVRASLAATSTTVTLAAETAGTGADNVNLTLTAAGTGTVDVTSRMTHNLPVTLKAYTVATLPAGNAGDVAYVTDALAPTYNAALVGGGAIVVTVFYTGAAWVSQ